MMTPNPLKTKLRRRRQTFGCWVTLAHPSIPELFSYAGFDWMGIDMEHSSIDIPELLPLIVSAEARGLVPLVRIGELNPSIIHRVMDVGAYGIIAANVRSREDAKLVVNAVKYPPMGSRGVGLYRAQGYGETFRTYKQWSIDETVVVVQIEHIDAVQNLDSIFSIPGIDACMIGPYDLSASMGYPGEYGRASVKRTFKEILRVANQYKVVPGIHSVPSDWKEARRRVKEGYRFLAFGTDFMFLKDSAKNAMHQLKSR